MDGIFLEGKGDRHVQLRDGLLERPAMYLRSPACQPIHTRGAELGDNLNGDLMEQLRESGLLVIQLEEPLSNESFIMLGSLLGVALAETASAVMPYVEDRFILNLIDEHTATTDIDLQPFAKNAISLHTEGSGRNAEDQPRYIILMCCEPGDTSLARTVLVPMIDVQRQLTSVSLALLERTRFRKNPSGPSIVRRIHERIVFSFRDFQAQALEWTYNGTDNSADVVNEAFCQLLASMYSPDVVTGVCWKRGMVVVMDNTFFFHGRTAGAASSQIRHLKRLRIR